MGFEDGATVMKNESPPNQEGSDTTEVEQLKNELAAVKDELQGVKQEFHNYRNAVSKKFSGHEDELAELEDRLEGASSVSNPKGEGGEDGSSEDDLLPIERIRRLKERGEDSPFEDTTPSVDRAVVLHENFREWSEKAPKGRVIKDGLKKLLNTALDAKLSWKQIYRTCRKLEEWSKGRITFTKTSRHGWMLVMGDERPSSVGGG